jgi:hypothetical protein
VEIVPHKCTVVPGVILPAPDAAQLDAVLNHVTDWELAHEEPSAEPEVDWAIYMFPEDTDAAEVVNVLSPEVERLEAASLDLTL